MRWNRDQNDGMTVISTRDNVISTWIVADFMFTNKTKETSYINNPRPELHIQTPEKERHTIGVPMIGLPAS